MSRFDNNLIMDYNFYDEGQAFKKSKMANGKSC